MNFKMKIKNFYNRELSWIDFNYRVLEEALDEKQPLLEKIKFLSIFSSNLDEFIMVRIARILKSSENYYSVNDKKSISKKELLKLIKNTISSHIEMQYKCFNNEILPKLEKSGIVFYNKETVPKIYMNFLKDYFIKKLFLIITPMAIDQSRPFPSLLSKSLNILVKLKEAKKEDPLYAVIPIPSIDRFIQLPDKVNTKFIYIGDVIKLFMQEAFKGYLVIDSCSFRITRDAELTIDEEDTADILSAIEDQLKQRAKGNILRLEIEKKANKELINYLNEKIDYLNDYIFLIDGPLDLASFFTISNLKGYENLKNEPLEPVIPKWFQNKKSNIFEIIKEKDRLLHLPFESFEPVVKFIQEASFDPKVLAIKMTLYRTSGDSPIVKALKNAVENRKQVTVLVELKAKFDEERNITWAKILEEAGCHVVYGLVGLKIHCKMTLVVRDEENGIRQYVHLSTGNYNDNTAKIYTDIGLFTAKQSFGRDVSAIFNLLTGYSEPPRWNKLVCAPLDLRIFYIERIEIEIKNVKNGGKGKIIAKLNSIIDHKIIDSLYKASNAGVEIILIVRGMCSLIPELKGVSENIKVISIVDRFLEHSRIYYFYNAGEEDIYLASADWMERNLDSRVETLFPIEDAELKNELILYLKYLLNDNQKSRILNNDCTYEKIKMKGNAKKVQAQIDYYKYIFEKNKIRSDNNHSLFIPEMNPEEEKI
ncbi:MAG: polyphosphate kinase 1 [Spirochaetes bacterium]|nr:polyphosphate kinase 1 [Spirochaetota bacterium]